MASHFSNTLFLPLALLIAIPGTSHSQVRDGAVIENIVVTARKREENLQDTPISITALNAGTIEQARLLEIKDIEAMTPNLNFIVGNDGSASTLQAFIRGIGQFDFAVTTDPGVGVYVDGVYLSRTIGANLEFADVEQVAILRGPQGTLFGKNTIGGAINVVTRRPSGDLNYSAEVTFGEHSYAGFDGYVEFPVSNQVSGSLSLLVRDSDGWQERNPGDDAGNDGLLGFRGHLLADPGNGWTSHLVIDWVDQDQNVYPRVLSDFDPTQLFPFFLNAFVLDPSSPCCNPNLNDIDRSSVANDDRDEMETLGLSWTNSWELGELTLKSITGFRRLEARILRDSDNDVAKLLQVDTIFDTDQFSQELLLSNATGSQIEWLVGAYYLKEDADHYSGVTVAEGLFEALSVLPDTITTPDGIPLRFLAVPLDLTLDYDRTQDTTSYAAFFTTTWHISDTTRLNLGARYTRDDKSLDTFTLRRASQTPIVLPGPTPPAECSDVVLVGNGSAFTCDRDWSEFSPKFGIDHDFSDDVMAYASVSRGFRSGAFNGRPLATEEISVADPETVTSYEVGFKSTLAERRLQINGALFRNDYEDQQLLVNQASASAAAGLILTVDNAAESTLTGAELELLARPTQALTIMSSLAWLDPEFDRFEQVDFVTGQIQDLSNRVFRDVPEWTGSLLAVYDVALPGGGILRLRGDLAYRDDIYYTNEETASTFERLHADSFTTLNAGVTYVTSNGDWEFSVFGRNLTDEREIVGGFVVDAFGLTDVSFSEPRRLFVSFKYTGGGS